MDESSSTRPSLLLRLRDGSDADAWHTFVSLYGGMINAYCVRRGLQNEDAAEVTQEVMIQVSRSIGSFDYQPGRGKFRGWLMTLTRTKLIEFLRKRARLPALLASLEAPESVGKVDGVWLDVWHAQLASSAIRIMQQRMNDPNYQAFLACWVNDESPEQVANRFQQDVAWVYVVKARGLKLLRQILCELADDEPDTEQFRDTSRRDSILAATEPTR